LAGTGFNRPPKKWDNPIKRKIIAHIAKKNVLKKTKGHYQAPLVALKVVEKVYGMEMEDANDYEAKEFGKLAVRDESKNLISIFLDSTKMKGKKTKSKGKPVSKVAVVGAGAMGSGIAWNTSYRGYPTLMKDVDPKFVSSGYRNAYGIYSQLKKLRKLNSNEISLHMNKLTGQVSYEGFGSVDLVIEAIVENMPVKKAQFDLLEDLVREDCILTTNTSTLDIDEMGSDLKHRDRFAGFHFFNPVNRMQLVEIIRGKETSDETIQTLLDVAKKMKKTPVVVRNSPGFLVNRILIPYLNGACKNYVSIDDVESYDKQFTDFGFPMGPFELMDVIGLDICHHVAESLNEFYQKRDVSTSPIFEFLNGQRLFGRKKGVGFYVYEDIGKRPNIALHNWAKKKYDGEPELIDIIQLMKDEAELCLNENIVDSQAELDIALIYGIGYPPFRKSVLNYEK
jgi:3-hydroxyacyl-CoA dehydrogenase/enoyl-CoA hydratase/3-hydroxybutyryl-CoA epimerase